MFRRVRLMILAFILGALVSVKMSCQGVQNPPAPLTNPRPVVTTHVVLVETPVSCGTGWALTHDLIVTARHVIVDEMPEKSITWPAFVVLYNGQRVKTTLMGTSEENDVAILRLDNPVREAPLYPLTVTDGPCYMGWRITSLGFPYCDGPVYGFGFTVGPHWMNWGEVDTTLLTLGGASGSPVMDENGTVIGMLVRAYNATNRGIMIGPEMLRRGIEESLRGR